MTFKGARDQFCCSPASVTYEFLLVDANQLLGIIGAEMDALGYSTALHTALQEARKYVADHKLDPNGGAGEDKDFKMLTRLANKVTSYTEKGTAPKKRPAVINCDINGPADWCWNERAAPASGWQRSSWDSDAG